MISDIRKALLQVSVNEADQYYLKFLCWGDYDAKKHKIFDIVELCLG